MILFADLATQDWIAGAGGWTAAAMLGSVLAWIFAKHLPAKDAQLKDLIGGHDAHVKWIIESHGATLAAVVKTWTDADRERREDYRANLKIVIDHCQRENATRDGVMLKAIDEARGAALDLREAIEELRKP